MPQVAQPLFISSRLMAALKVDGVGTLHLHAEHRDTDGRVVYRYVVEDTDGKVLSEGTDLSSGVGAEVDYTDTMVALLDFLASYGEEYRSTMSGTPFQEWCYVNSDELSIARCELDPEGEL